MDNNRLRKLAGMSITESDETLTESPKDWNKFNFHTVIKAMGGKFIEEDKDKSQVTFMLHNKTYILSDNGGEANITEIIEKPAINFSVGYLSNNFPSGQIKDKTFAYRLKQALDGKKIDYEKDVDDNKTRSIKK